MATAIRLEALPARLGDCLIVECLREGAPPWRMLIDGGPADTWPLLQARLERLDEPHIDVAVVTHIDSDHIGGFLPFARSEHARHVADFWFNGRMHLPSDLGAPRSVTQGESLTAALTGGDDPGARAAAELPWNRTFDGRAIDTGEEGGFLEFDVPEGPRITVLSPTTKRLGILAAKWPEAVEAAQRGDDEASEPDVPAPIGDLAVLADEKWPRDGSAPNGSSIALLIEHRGASLIVSGDAFGNVLGAALARLAEARGVAALAIDAFKLPHHGSRGNVSAAMLAAAPARHYIVSSNGDTFHHPDDAAIARAVLTPPSGATLWFNYRNARTERWSDPALTTKYGYSTRYPEAADAGAVLELDARP